MSERTTETEGTTSGDWRDPAIFGPLEARVKAEERPEQQEKEAQTGRVKRKNHAATRAGHGGSGSRRKRSARANRPERPDAAPASNAPARARRRHPATGPGPKAPVSAAFVAAKEKAIRAARDIRRKYGDGLSREEFIRLANAFRSAVVPRRKPGRRPKPRITAAYLDWKAGMHGADLYRKHIPGWSGHNRYHRIGEQKELMDAIRSRRRRDRVSPKPTAS